jgi:hypothetical protein
MSQKDERMTIDELIDNLDFNAVLKRFLGGDLTEEEAANCKEFDELCAALLPSMAEID